MFRATVLILAVMCAVASAITHIRIETNYGVIEAELYDSKAPITVNNFKTYVQSRHYDNTIAHRVINRFMVQMGGFDQSFMVR